MIVKNCTFDNNTSNGDYAAFSQYHGGGLSISYILNVTLVSNISIVVTDCYFNNNTATSSSSDFALHQFVSQRSLGSRGGGLAITVSTPSIVNCVVNNSMFVNNTSSFLGGGLFCIALNTHSHQTYTLENLTFNNNHAMFAGGLFYRTNGSQNHSDEASVKATILNCLFMANTATVAGAVIISIHDQIVNSSVEFNGCMFTKNLATDYAGTVDISSHNFFVDRSYYAPIAFTDW